MTDDYEERTPDRLPPHDLAAEKGLLCACMHSRTALAMALETVHAEDFWGSTHATIFTAMAAMYAAGQPTDPITVAKHLADNGDLDMVGGQRYIFDLSGNGTLSTFASEYAEIIVDRALRRSLADYGEETARTALMTSGDTFGLVERAVAKAREIRDRGQANSDLPTLDLLDFVAVEDTYNWLIPGLLEYGDRLVLTATEGGGKALALETPIPTPKGWTTMGALTVGQEVFAPDGTTTRIIAATQPMLGRPCYRMRFSDGAEIVADAGHLWLTETLAAREATAKAARRGPLQPRGTDQSYKRKHFPAVVTTEHIASTLRARGGHALNHSIQTTAPLEYPAQELSVDPYVLGAWLGDGHSAGSRITCHPDDAEILEHIRAAGIPVRKQSGQYLWGLGDGLGGGKRGTATLAGKLRALGLINNKHIPTAYLQGSVEQRLALLQGLMDTDGTVSGNGSSTGRGSGTAKCEFSVVNERLARDFHELVLSLGIKAVFRSGPAKLNGRTVGTRYRVQFQSELPVFRLRRKAERLTPIRTRRSSLRYIEAAEPIESVPVRCIQVDRPDGMFVAGRECIPTHNSTFLRQIAVTTASGLHPFRTWEYADPHRVLVLDCENGAPVSRRKFRPLLDAGAKVDRPLQRGMFHIECRPEGLDLTRPADRAWLMRRVEKLKPELLIIGPIYRLHAGDPNSEELARKVSAVIDEARATANCAVLMEAHAPHHNGQSAHRNLRPLGSSLWMRWPEFGFGLRPVEDEKSASNADGCRGRRFMPWRGLRDERDWPQFLKQGEHWPWTAYNPVDLDTITGHSPTGAIW